MSENIRPSGVFDTSYEQDIMYNRTGFDRLLAAVFLLAILAAPLLTRNGLLGGLLGAAALPTGAIGTIKNIAIFMIAVQGLNLLTGFTGQVSLGQAAFVGVGAYATAVFMRELGMNYFIALPLAALFAGLVGLIFGLPSLRVKGFYLVMATLAAQFIIPWIIRGPLTPVTNGANPLDVPLVAVGSLEFSDTALYYVIVIVTFVAMIAARNLLRSRVGRAFISVRDNDLAAELLGINVFTYKLRAFFLCALYAGLAGGLLAVKDFGSTITPDSFELDDSIEYLAMLIIGGAGFTQAAFFGVSFVQLLKETVIPILSPFLLDTLPALLLFIEKETLESRLTASLTPMLFGGTLLLFLIFEPRGLAHRWEILKIWWKLRPFSH